MLINPVRYLFAMPNRQSTGHIELLSLTQEDTFRDSVSARKDCITRCFRVPGLFAEGTLPNVITAKQKGQPLGCPRA